MRDRRGAVNVASLLGHIPLLRFVIVVEVTNETQLI
jgi:hypothetical protein